MKQVATKGPTAEKNSFYGQVFDMDMKDAKDEKIKLPAPLKVPHDES
jgi:hypothetical protein